ncbi:hypothetical protein, partial [Oceanihabitans sediminis]|uniref:hypothetical protein n=1 Tax=Oceanihabitans sediminis TaxID=1812012 RepID=UPI00299E2BA4
MSKLNIFIIICGMLIFANCANSKKQNKIESENSSIWRDNNEKDSISFYSSNESCEKIIGKLKIKSRLHKNLMEK